MRHYKTKGALPGQVPSKAQSKARERKASAALRVRAELAKRQRSGKCGCGFLLVASYAQTGRGRLNSRRPQRRWSHTAAIFWLDQPLRVQSAGQALRRQRGIGATREWLRHWNARSSEKNEITEPSLHLHHSVGLVHSHHPACRSTLSQPVPEQR